MSLLRSLFSPNGRVSRKYYWLFLVGLAFYAAFAVAMSFGALYVYEKLLYVPRYHHTGVELNQRMPAVVLFVALVVIGALAAVPVLNVMIKRMHDRNHSARWLPIWIAVALVTILVHNMFNELFRRSFPGDWWFVSTRYGADLLSYSATMVLGGLPTIALFASRTYRNLTSWPVTQSIFALPVLIPLMLYGLWFLVEAGFRRGTVGPNEYGRDPLQK